MAKRKCAHPHFECGHCGATGCRVDGCKHRQFVPVDQCKDCGRSYELRALAEDADAPPKSKERQPFRIEIVFAAGLALLTAALVAARFVAHSGAAAPPLGAKIQAAHFEAAGAGDMSLCQCFYDGFDLAAQKFSANSPEYRTGYSLCRATLGIEGGRYWTGGFNAGAEGRRWGRNCRAWEKQRNF